MGYVSAPTMAGLKDGDLSNPVGGNLAQYDAGTGLWELIATDSLVGQVLGVAGFRGNIAAANGALNVLIDLTLATYSVYAGAGIAPNGAGGLALDNGNYFSWVSVAFGATSTLAGLTPGGQYSARSNNLGLAAQSYWCPQSDLVNANLLDSGGSAVFTVAAQPYQATLVNSNNTGVAVAGTYALTILRVVG